MNSESRQDADYEHFLEHFSRDRDRLFGYIYALLPHKADAEDVFQRSSLLLWKKFSDYDPSRPFLPWACTIAHYEVKNFIRSVHRDRLQFDADLINKLAETRGASTTKPDRRLEALRRCLQGIKSVERELIELMYRGDTTVKEFAEASELSVQTLYNRISLTRRKLLNCVQRRLAQQGAAT